MADELVDLESASAEEMVDAKADIEALDCMQFVDIMDPSDSISFKYYHQKELFAKQNQDMLKLYDKMPMNSEQFKANVEKLKAQSNEYLNYFDFDFSKVVGAEVVLTEQT